MRKRFFNNHIKILKYSALFTLSLLSVLLISGCDNDESVNPELSNQNFKSLAEEHGFNPALLSEGIDTAASRPYSTAFY